MAEKPKGDTPGMNVVLPAQVAAGLTSAVKGGQMRDEQIAKLFKEIQKSAGAQAQLAALAKNQTLALKNGVVESKKQATDTQKWLREQSTVFKALTSSTGEFKGFKNILKDTFSGGGLLKGLSGAIGKFGLLGDFSETFTSKMDEWQSYVKEQQAEREKEQISLIEELSIQQKLSGNQILKTLTKSGMDRSRAESLLVKANDDIAAKYLEVIRQGEQQGKSLNDIIFELREQKLLEKRSFDEEQRWAETYQKSSMKSDYISGLKGLRGEGGEEKINLDKDVKEYLSGLDKQLGKEKISPDVAKKQAEILAQYIGTENQEVIEKMAKTLEAHDPSKSKMVSTEIQKALSVGKAPKAQRVAREEQVETYTAMGGSPDTMNQILDILSESGEELKTISFDAAGSHEKTKHIAKVLDKYTGEMSAAELAKERRAKTKRKGKEEEEKDDIFSLLKDKILDRIPGGRFLKGGAKGLVSGGASMIKNMLPMLSGVIGPVIAVVLTAMAGFKIGGWISDKLNEAGIGISTQAEKTTKMTDAQRKIASEKGYTGPDDDVAFNEWLRNKGKAKMGGTQTSSIPEIEKKKVEAQQQQTKAMTDIMRETQEAQKRGKDYVSGPTIISAPQNAVDKIPNSDLSSVAKGAGR